MIFALVVDAYYPFKSSAAIQIGDLAKEFKLNGHEVIVITPNTEDNKKWTLSKDAGVNILRLSAMRTKSNNHLKRAIAELLLSVFMIINFRKSSIAKIKFDGVIWYSPTIFFGLFVHYLKIKSQCRAYLILRDIFPDIAVDLGIIKRGLVYKFFKIFERYQYKNANFIGVQSKANIPYLQAWAIKNSVTLEVLDNWQKIDTETRALFPLSNFIPKDKKIIVYAGNVGVMQGADQILRFAKKIESYTDWVILLVGRGTEVSRLKKEAESLSLKNLIFHNEIDTHEVKRLLIQCDIGLVLLDPRLTTHNIPGKIISYLQAELPILGNINEGNDLYELIADNQLGLVSTGFSDEVFFQNGIKLMGDDELRELASKNSKIILHKQFNVTIAYAKIFNKFSPN